MLPTAQGPAPFPWREAMAIGFGLLRLSSREFWALTPRELAAAIEGLTGRTHAPMDRAGLDDLMRRFPDPVQTQR
ncbi:phage tail assembly chaperone [Kaistia defluvii]|uniref:rcc01693 family protein n=1 Tax=Kaistia defluvii TaxID=410841 RepID=UPI002259EC7E|nr:rcc01693 family protein [Kaistia defluvii]MCX5519482.1 phage tail assembly chaperone [Kaistia defluvii]